MNNNLTSQMVKEYAKSIGADLCGIASMDRFEGAPKQQDPRYIMPRAKACIVLAFRIPRGYFRGIEEGTFFGAYNGLGYGNINQVVSPLALRELCCFIEDYGYEAAPCPNIFNGCSVRFDTQKHDPNLSLPVKEGLPNPDILVDYRVAAYAAGLGEFGYSKVFLTPEFGPFQRFVLLLTDAPLEADPIYEGHLCDRCMRCARACSGQAISTTETETITIAGHKIEYGKLDVQKCSVAYMGGNIEYNPFLKKDADLSKVPETYHGAPVLSDMVGLYGTYSHNPPIEGARGCMRECYAHLEERGVLTRGFVNSFREKGTKPWKITPEMRKAFVESDGISDANEE